jgi:hypothetical protein
MEFSERVTAPASRHRPHTASRRIVQREGTGIGASHYHQTVGQSTQCRQGSEQRRMHGAAEAEASASKGEGCMAGSLPPASRPTPGPLILASVPCICPRRRRAVHVRAWPATTISFLDRSPREPRRAAWQPSMDTTNLTHQQCSV